MHGSNFSCSLSRLGAFGATFAQQTWLLGLYNARQTAILLSFEQTAGTVRDWPS